MPFPNLGEIITVTLRNRTGTLVDGMMKNNALLNALLNPWEPQEPGTVSLPDYIRLSAQGKAKMVNGRVCLLKGSDNVDAA
jgi:hypothetical protein